jgi:hypothetical protein
MNQYFIVFHSLASHIDKGSIKVSDSIPVNFVMYVSSNSLILIEPCQFS